MKTAFVSMLLLFGLSQARAQDVVVDTLPDYPPCSLTESNCDDGTGGGHSHNNNGHNDDGIQYDYRTCTAADSSGRHYRFTASYQYPSHYIVDGAINACRAASRTPQTCRWAECHWAN